MKIEFKCVGARHCGPDFLLCYIVEETWDLRTF